MLFMEFLEFHMLAGKTVKLNILKYQIWLGQVQPIQ